MSATLDAPVTTVRDYGDQALLIECDGTDDVLAWVSDEFGPQAVARPAGGAAGLAIWLVPAAIFVAGALVVVRVIRRGRVAATSA